MNELIESHEQLLERQRILDQERSELKKRIRESRSEIRHAKDKMLTEGEIISLERRIKSIYNYLQTITDGHVEINVRKVKKPINGNLLIEMEDTNNMKESHNLCGIYVTFTIYRRTIYKLICAILGNSDGCYDKKQGCDCGKYTWTLCDESGELE
jgi:hypothetical protein